MMEEKSARRAGLSVSSRAVRAIVIRISVTLMLFRLSASESLSLRRASPGW
jgi:hypothetical protein